jgi:hypothetical protein
MLASSYLELGPAAGGPIDDLLGHSITYRVAVGPRAGQKVFSLQMVPARRCRQRRRAVQNTAVHLPSSHGRREEGGERVLGEYTFLHKPS